MESPDPALNSADSQEVKWQVAFFALVPLALGAMTQPVGRVLDAPPELRFWLRSSPLFCATDMLCFILRIAANYVLQPELSWRHVRAELSYRFRDEDWTRDSGRDFEKAALGRWLLLLLGGIPCQTIKLVAMRGIPVTQAAALMFFLALVFGEVIRVAAESMLRNLGGLPVPVQVPPSALVRWTSLWLGERMYAVSHFWHIAIFAWAIHVLHVAWHNASSAEPPPGPAGPWPVTVTLLSLLLVATLAGVFIPSSQMSARLPVPEDEGFPYRYLLGGPLIVSLPIGWTLLLQPWFGTSTVAVTSMVISGLVVDVMVLVVWLFVLHGLTSLSETRAGHLIGVPRASSEHDSLLMFVFIVSITIGSYAYVYDGRGTVNPEWLGIFG